MKPCWIDHEKMNHLLINKKSEENYISKGDGVYFDMDHIQLTLNCVQMS